MSTATSGRRLKPVNTPLRPVNVDAVAFTVNFMAPSALEIIEMSLIPYRIKVVLIRSLSSQCMLIISVRVVLAISISRSEERRSCSLRIMNKKKQ